MLHICFSSNSATSQQMAYPLFSCSWTIQDNILKLQKLERFSKQKFNSHSSGGWKVNTEALADLVSEEGLLPGSQMATSCFVLMWWNRLDNSRGLLVRGFLPFTKAEPKHTPKSTSFCIISISANEFGGTQIGHSTLNPKRIDSPLILIPESSYLIIQFRIK